MLKKNQARINIGITDAIMAIIANAGAVIPATASSSNKLADINFVNSSIATATATFRGTYNLVSDLSLTTSATTSQIATAIATKLAALSITADNNDYVFVQIPTADATPTIIASIERYKYDGTSWAYEYTLNNSGFTAEQWAAINSGITSALVTQITTNQTNIGTKLNKSFTATNGDTIDIYFENNSSSSRGGAKLIIEATNTDNEKIHFEIDSNGSLNAWQWGSSGYRWNISGATLGNFQYNPSKSYEVGDCIINGTHPKIYMCIVACTGCPPHQYPQYWQQVDGRGVQLYYATSTYSKFDLVTHNGVLYVSMADSNTGHTPSSDDGTYWHKGYVGAIYDQSDGAKKILNYIYDGDIEYDVIDVAHGGVSGSHGKFYVYAHKIDLNSPTIVTRGGSLIHQIPASTGHGFTVTETSNYSVLFRVTENEINFRGQTGLIYSPTHEYAVNDICLYSNRLFVCLTAHNSNGSSPQTPNTSADTSYWARVFV